MKAAIIDDDQIFTNVLEHYISKVEFMVLGGIYHDVASAFNAKEFRQADLLFLDIEMPEMTGIELLDSLGDAAPIVIVVSAKKEYGVEAFDYNAIDYLHKPVSFSRFMKAANKVRKEFNKKSGKNTGDNDHFFIRCNGLWTRLAFTDVFVIKGDNNNVVIKTSLGNFNTPMRLKEIGEKLPKDQFMQVHRSYIVNLSKVNMVDGDVLKTNNVSVPVSKTYIDDLYKRLKIER